jgi:hypothetical protein
VHFSKGEHIVKNVNIGLLPNTAAIEISSKRSMRELMQRIGIQYDRLGINVGTLPFAPADVTAGSESEMQTIVKGAKTNVDLPIVIEQSNYLTNIRRRAKSGDASPKIMTDLEKYLNTNASGIWENSWVRLPMRKLGSYAHTILRHDLSRDKKHPNRGRRGDIDRFLFQTQQEDCLRIPTSYLLKLSLAEMLASPRLADPLIHSTGRNKMDNFQNDNTSPETSSLHIVTSQPDCSIGKGIAVEMSIRYLLVQILMEYANQKFSLRENGQEALMFFSPHPPVRQKALSQCISDSFYRELFMNPCLSGWTKGEEKHQYMHLCHRVLSRSQFNAVLKLREAGIITSNLVSLPNLSNISLANNGTHVSLGSSKLSALIGNPSSGYTRHSEKYLGDLVVKIVEHFLPLFVGTYTAAPHRMGFEDFHPEKAMGFLPHELDYTHLRMLWRRWKKKADLSALGYRLTPFGPRGLDRFISKMFGLKGDFVPDFRLIDYLVAILSTDQSPALNGRLNNSLQLKQDLTDLGVFDTKMSLYLFDKLREFDVMGFSGFEGRHYSLFNGFMEDMAQGVDLQNLIYLLAFKYIATGSIGHEDIPDDPFIESERRQIIFGSAIDLPTFFIHRDTRNSFLRRVLENTNRVRPSGRYDGYVRVYNLEYRKALLNILRTDAADLIEMLNMKETIRDLESRMINPDACAASGKITRGILDQIGSASPLSVEPEIFNQAAEKYYRTTLRKKHITESFDLLRQGIKQLGQAGHDCGADLQTALHALLRDKDPEGFIETLQKEFLDEQARPDGLEKLAGLILIYVAHKDRQYHHYLNQGVKPYEASVC